MYLQTHVHICAYIYSYVHGYDSHVNDSWRTQECFMSYIPLSQFMCMTEVAVVTSAWTNFPPPFFVLVEFNEA